MSDALCFFLLVLFLNILVCTNALLSCSVCVCVAKNIVQTVAIVKLNCQIFYSFPQIFAASSNASIVLVPLD